MDAVHILFVIVFSFGGVAAAFAWTEAQDRGPIDRAIADTLVEALSPGSNPGAKTPWH